MSDYVSTAMIQANAAQHPQLSVTHGPTRHDQAQRCRTEMGAFVKANRGVTFSEVAAKVGIDDDDLEYILEGFAGEEAEFNPDQKRFLGSMIEDIYGNDGRLFAIFAEPGLGKTLIIFLALYVPALHGVKTAAMCDTKLLGAHAPLIEGIIKNTSNGRVLFLSQTKPKNKMTEMELAANRKFMEALRSDDHGAVILANPQALARSGLNARENGVSLFIQDEASADLDESFNWTKLQGRFADDSYYLGMVGHMGDETIEKVCRAR
jgi:hypothetical protein